MDEQPENSPWICHVCDFKSSASASRACSLCYRVACPAHLQTRSVYNEESGLYELQAVCVACVIQ